jgi:hypothetical protein
LDTGATVRIPAPTGKERRSFQEYPLHHNMHGDQVLLQLA